MEPSRYSTPGYSRKACGRVRSSAKAVPMNTSAQARDHITARLLIRTTSLRAYQLRAGSPGLCGSAELFLSSGERFLSRPDFDRLCFLAAFAGEPIQIQINDRRDVEREQLRND